MVSGILLGPNGNCDKTMYDFVITNGKMVDGTGSPWRFADVAVEYGKIARIAKHIAPAEGENVIDAKGLIVCPGFVDAHSHADVTLLADERMDFRILQGITTEVVAQDGLSYAPLNKKHLDEWRRYLIGLNGDYGDRVSWDWSSTAELLDQYDGKASNAVHLIPHGGVRVEVMGWVTRHATRDELKQMQAIVRRSLEEGAAGISTGLTYIPCSHANTEEMIALCEPVGDAGGLLSIHLRSYAGKLLEAIEESIEMGRQSGAAIQISHLRMADKSTWGLSHKVLELIDSARNEGVDVTFDQYPYTVGCAPLFCLIPAWAQAGGPDAILDRLKDQPTRDKISAELDTWGIDWSNYALSNMPKTPYGEWEGISLMDGAKAVGTSVYGFIMDVLLNAELDATIIAGGGNEEDNCVMLTHHAGMIGSDGVPVGGKPHPRGYGTYPRLFETYVKELGLLRLEEAIHKMSGMPAARHNLQDRGTLEVGKAADVVVFSLENMKDNASFENALQYTEGVEAVLINGQAAVLEWEISGKHLW